jgi:hypothetical protein
MTARRPPGAAHGGDAAGDAAVLAAKVPVSGVAGLGVVGEDLERGSASTALVFRSLLVISSAGVQSLALAT